MFSPFFFLFFLFFCFCPHLCFRFILPTLYSNLLPTVSSVILLIIKQMMLSKQNFLFPKKCRQTTINDPFAICIKKEKQNKCKKAKKYLETKRKKKICIYLFAYFFKTLLLCFCSSFLLPVTFLHLFPIK